ncbi:MAG: sulfurtransferase complex subunit TusC [Halioglobus sp.]
MIVAISPKKSTLIVVRHSPYGSSLARASIDAALAHAAFGQPVDLLFMGDGVLQLLPCQDSSAIDARNIGRLLASLPMYDIDSIYIDARAAAHYKLDISQVPLDARPLENAELHQLMAQYDHLMGF